ncbi:MAG: glutathione S-transferase N-terminal domain-containing protein [Myxococcota bacterium]|nr:glutathione S-transferase N-terminal domain-containing protein [Myxococcota bacterium]
MRRLVALPYSPWSIKARWALDHHGVEYRYEPYMPMLGEPVLRARMGWPRGAITVPVLFDGRVVLAESLPIARHAEKVGARAPLFPEGRDADVVHWNGLSDVIARAGRALLTPRMARSAAALIESMPPSIPKALRRASVPAAELALKYIARKHGVREEEEAQDRGTIRWTLRKLRESLERGDYILGALSYADVAMIASLQMVLPSRTLAKVGDASAAAWTDDALAREHADVLAWRDRVVERHFVPMRRDSARSTGRP